MKTKNSLLIKLVSTLCFVVAGVCADDRSQAADLFSSVTVGEANSVAKVDSDILKRRIVRVNFAELAKQTRVGAKLRVNLYDDMSMEGIVEKVEDRAARNYTLSGHLDGDEFSTFAVSVLEDAVAINVRRANGDFYQVRFVQGELHEIYQVDDSAIPECAVKPEHSVRLPAAAADAPPQTQGDAGDVVDVMVVYTSAARIAAGSSNAIHAAINLGVFESNTAYQQSQINMQVRLVYAGEVAYTQAGFSTDLSRLRTAGDGHLDEVQTLRNTYGADLVSLWINDTSACGLAYVMSTLSPTFEALGFSVVHWGPQCATGYYSFSHEMAHNMGCHHDRANAGGGPYLYPYGFGWRFTGTDGIQYRTIMGYAPGTRIQRFSNPNVNYMGTSTGVAIGQVNESHNALVINNTAYTVANFRQTVISNPPSGSVGDAVENPGFSWTTFGNASWINQTNITHDGVDAAESGVISDNGFSNFETPIVGPGTLSFWWKVSSEEGWDYLDVVFNGTVLLQYGISGDVDWTPMSFEIPAGTHTWGWQYSKDVSFFDGADKAWVDQISYVGGSSFATNSLGKTNGQYKFVWNGLAGATYTIQASTNLTSWATLTNLIISSPTNLFIDSGSTGLSNRFYRIHSP